MVMFRGRPTIGMQHGSPRTFQISHRCLEALVDKTGHWHIGNRLGNIHVLCSSDNRSLGDYSVGVKLKNAELARNAQILETQIADWIAASGNEESPRHLDKVRALAFQTAVEKRTFPLYEKFYADLKFESQWCSLGIFYPNRQCLIPVSICFHILNLSKTSPGYQCHCCLLLDPVQMSILDSSLGVEVRMLTTSCSPTESSIDAL
jgi:hypothetical protein